MLKKIILTREGEEVVIHTWYEGDLGRAEKLQTFHVREGNKALKTTVYELLALIAA